MNVQGSVVLVTGGGRGIGRALGEAFVRHGASVVLGDVDADLVEAAAGEVGCRGLRLDVTDADSSAEVVAEVQRTVGPIDILVNNAGIMPLGPHHSEPDELTRRIFEVNVLGPIALTRLVLPGMVERCRGSVVTVASSAGVSAVPGGVSYSASKAASLRWAEGLRRELHGTGVTVVAVTPGIVRTELSAGLTDARGVPTLTPAQVAARVLHAVLSDRPEVWVPARLRLFPAIAGLVPRKGSDLLVRAVGGDRVFGTRDAAARQGYENRVRSGLPDHLH